MATHPIDHPESSLIFSAACNTPLATANARIERSADESTIYSFQHRDRTIIVDWYDDGSVVLLIEEPGKPRRVVEI